MMFRQMSYEIMEECRNLFPQFRWDLLRKRIDWLVSCGLAKNLTDIKQLIGRTIENSFETSMHLNQAIFWGYDVKKYGLYYDSGLKHESLFECMYDYAQAYFVYQSDFALLTSNYPIRVEHTQIKNDHMIHWDYNWFKKECYDLCPAEYSKVVDYDMFRLKKKNGQVGNTKRSCSIFKVI